jgi:hypothetical protein
MSLSAARKYFVDQFKLAGYTEHFDPFDADNVPNTIMHKTFKITIGPFTARKALNQRDQEMDCPVSVTIFLKGYANPALAMDGGMDQAEVLCTEILKAQNRLGNPVKNVTLNRIAPEAFAATNNSIAMVTMEFTALIIFGTN